MAKRRKRSIEALVTIDGFDLRWQLRTEAQYVADGGFKGMTFSVEMVDGPHRELILEYPFPKKRPTGFGQLPERAEVSEDLVERAIRQAMQAGWNPVSRGKPFVFRVPEERD